MPTSYHSQEAEEVDLLSTTASNPDDSMELQETKSKLLELKQKMEEYERRERELENLRLRRQEVISGQKIMREKLTRALTTLEQSDYELRRQVEQIQLARQTFSEHLQEMEEINPNEWPADDMNTSIDKAMSQIEHAKTIYNQSRARITALSGQDIEENYSDTQDDTQYSDANSFGALVKRGFAFSLPLLVVLAVLIVVLLIRG